MDNIIQTFHKSSRRYDEENIFTNLLFSDVRHQIGTGQSEGDNKTVPVGSLSKTFQGKHTMTRHGGAQ